MIIDKAKQPLDCKEDTTCVNIKCIYEGYHDETWECLICGVRFKLYYEDMQ